MSQVDWTSYTTVGVSYASFAMCVARESKWEKWAWC